MEEHKRYTQEQLKEMWEAAQAAAPPFQHLTFVSVLGGPGSGQGMQCALLAQHFGFKHINMGAMMRVRTNRPGSPLAAAIYPAQTDDQLDADVCVAIDVLKQHLEETAAQGQKAFIIDGMFLPWFPRNLAQLHYFEKTIGAIKLILYLDHDDDALTKRLHERGRVEDTPDVINKRLVAFRVETRPVLEYLEKRATRAQMYCRVVGWEEDAKLAADLRLGVEEALKK